jgi:thiamine transport system ATP-binding protein
MLQCLRLCVAFDDTYALDTVNLTVNDGEVVAVMGPSGCGKTTLLRAIAGLQALDEGTIAWDGRNLRGTPPHARGFGFMFQDYALFPHLTVRENVAFGLRMQGHSMAGREKRTAEVLEIVGLADYAQRRIHELSGGEQQRVALARTLAPAPRLILLDEPIGALDRTLREHLLAEMQSIFADLTVTALYVTHDRDEAFAIAETVAVMDRGRLLRKGTPEELWRDPKHEFVARMLGFDAIVNAKVYDGWADLGWARVVSELDSGEHRLAIPPHAVVVTPAGTVTGEVRKATYRAGSYDLDIAVGTTIIHATSGDHYSVGETISFDLTARDLMAIRA